MNKTITDGIVFTPPKFAFGLHHWSSQDGTPGQDDYDNEPNAALVPADQDFSGCLELTKTQAVQKLRAFYQTPLSPGCYLRIRTRVKLVSGAFPTVSIAGWPGAAGNVHLTGVNETGPVTSLNTYGEVVELSAIVGSGNRTGVDLHWGKDAIYGHFGLDLTGPSGGVVRIEDIIIEDISGAFVDQLIGAVDVRDYGAIGDGLADDHDAFEAADKAAAGREVLVPRGTFRINGSITFQNRVRFVGNITMPDSARLTLLKDFNLPSYIDAFGDEVLAFKKAYQSLLNFNDYYILDMGGRRIELDEPLDMQAAVNNKTVFNSRRVVQNGQIQANANVAWNTDQVVAQATYSTSDPKSLSSVANIANIAVGSLVEGTGVGREVYVKDVNVGSQSLTLSQPLYGAAGTHQFTFTRFKYLLDFSGFQKVSGAHFDGIDFQCTGNASAVLLPSDGETFHFRDCLIVKPKDRGITSPGTACQGMMFDRCQFISNESPLKVQDRVSIAFNANKNDVKIRDCRARHFKHFGILDESGSVITGNHWFHGDKETNGVRKGGIVFTTTNLKTLITGNYVDNNFIEWTNEYEADPSFANQYSFGGLTITGNIFTANDVASWFSFLVIKPYGPGHFLHGLTMTGNVFRSINGPIDRVESVDNTFATLNHSKARNIVVHGNTFNAINDPVYNPCTLEHTQASDTQTWVVDFAPQLPFNGRARTVEAVVPVGAIQSGSANIYELPHSQSEQGGSGSQVKLTWSRACRGSVNLTARMDNPT